MRICTIASEFAPYAKTGGLGDVTAALASNLHLQGHEVRVFLPLYASIDRRRIDLTPVDFLQDVLMDAGGAGIRYSVYTGQQADGLWLYFIDCPMLYARPGLYTSDDDEHLRFVVLCRSALQCCQRMGWSPDIAHSHDWQSALVPLFLRTIYAWDQMFAGTRTVLSIHNIGYQGVFDANRLDSTGLGPYRQLLHQDDLNQGRINFLKTGILYASALTTVSPTYAREICTPEYGMGLDDLLRQRKENLHGILNGVDYEVWNPERDELIPHQYSADNLSGKALNKTALQNRCDLHPNPDVPIIGIVSRLVSQKGFSLAFDVLQDLLRQGRVQLAVVGSGESQYEEFFEWLVHEFPHQAAFWRGFNNPLAHLVEAGSDIFLMPSLYEPCGLNQMYSLRYGTIPVVRRTGGLADTVTPHSQEDGNGVVFEHSDANALRWALDTALTLYADKPGWRKMVGNAMAQNFSWQSQIRYYIRLYNQVLSRAIA